MPDSGGNFSLVRLLDEASSLTAMRERTRSTLINSLLEVLESEPDEDDAIALTAAFVVRQAGRGYMDRQLALRLARDLMKIMEEASEGTKKETARKLLGLLKWISETVDKSRIDVKGVGNFQDLLDKLQLRWRER